MAQGTISLTNGSVNVTGSGTKFTDYADGSFITLAISGVPYTIAIDTVTNDTTMTLVVNFDGPTVSGVAFEVTGVNTMALATMGVTTQAQRALRMLLADQSNWRQIFSDNETITITLPNGQQLTGMSWGYISQQLADLDINEIIAMRDEMRLLDASAKQSSQDAATAQGKAETAQSGAETALSTSQQVLADTEAAKLAAETAKSGAETAASSAAGSAATSTSEADRAKGYADSLDPDTLVKKSENLSDLDDIPTARSNLEVFSKTEIADLLPGYLGQIDFQEMRTALEPGTAPRDGQEVSQTGIFADLYAKGVAGKLPVCTESEWQADPLKRGCYVLESSPGMMRLPDDNGVQPGSLKIPVMVGDGGDASKAGSMGASELPNITGEITRIETNISASRNTGVLSGAFSFGDREPVSPPANAPSGTTSNLGVPIKFSARDSNEIYNDNVTEVRPNRRRGCWTVRFAAKATNGGSIDALALATAIAAGDAELLAKIIATNARIDYALISPETNPALGSRTVHNNPFGSNTPVFCLTEIFHATLQKWVTTPWAFGTVGHGILSSYSEGEGIVTRCASGSFVASTATSGTSQEFTANYTTASPVRIHVWKITA